MNPYMPMVRPKKNRLWIVDAAGYQYLRASADAGWYQRLVANPRISVERDGQRRAYVAVPDPGETLALN
ncbi:nitroreductase family deazaflavin-dependent oxidoreductase [Pseudomonadales bacterium]|nr:nitroreductase family deazaflavin-dependent oxidoreductase [Pseudomonadales bacterium]